MHEGAYQRMQELIQAWVNTMELAKGYLTVDSLIGPAASAVTTFLAKTFREWITEGDALIGVANRMQIMLTAEGLKESTGRLADLVDPPTLARIAREFSDWWKSLPRTYSIEFPLPSVKWVGDEPIAIGPGMELTYLVGIPPPNPGLFGLGGPLSALGQFVQVDTHACVLRLESSGLITSLSSDQLTVSKAIRRAKQVLQLAVIVGALDTGYTGKSPPPSARAQDLSTPQEIETVLLPAGFASSLARLVFTDPLPKAGVTRTEEQITENRQRRADQFARVGKIVDAATRATQKKPQVGDDYVALHCARIVTASEWLFDSESEANSAIAYVQVAIAFEALYGGDKDEPIVETLANRVAYSLAQFSEERASLRIKFIDFYGKRSRIVHNGASLLDSEEQKWLLWAKRTMRQALTHELSIVGPLPGDDPAAREKMRLLVQALGNETRSS